MDSIFSRAYAYRQRENKNNLENYLIELVGYCLEYDKIFRTSFLKILALDDFKKIKINTQAAYAGFGIPDIEIFGDDTHLIIECKIDSEERENQLEDYVKILKKKNKHSKCLIYLTKYKQTKTLSDSKIFYKNINWWDVSNIIDENCNEITRELKLFLNENNIAMNKNFTTVDLLAIETIAETISKMDVVLDSVKDYFNEKFGNLSKGSSRSTRLKNGAYHNYKSIGNPWKYNIDLGFMWWYDDSAIQLVIRLFIPKKNDEDGTIVNFFKSNLIEWDVEEFDDVTFIGIYFNLNENVANKEDQISVMTAFLKEGIDELYEVKKKNSSFF